MGILLNVAFYIVVFINTANAQESQYYENEDSDQTVSICKVCDCFKTNTTEYDTILQVYCTNVYDGLNDFTTIAWPTDEDLSMVVILENLGWTSIKKIPDNNKVVSLSFDNNAIRNIWPGAFSSLLNLKYLQISKNQLSGVTPDIFKNLLNLVDLNLSDNKLSTFNRLDFVDLLNLKSLNLRNNFFTKIPMDAIQKLQSLEQFDISGNQIYFLNFEEHEESNWIEKMRYLDLSNNKLSTIYSKYTFEKATSLEYLNLSSNAIVAIETNTFQDCAALKVLDLSNNALSDLPELSPPLEILYLQLNAFKKWPNLPGSLKMLDISKNNLFENYDESYMSFENLEFLNMSGNILSEFSINHALRNLKYLDLSYNMLSEISPSLSIDRFPSLEDLHIDGNSIEILSFTSNIELKKLSARYLDKIRSLDASGFSKLKAKHSPESIENFDGNSECLDVAISHCENLEKIHEDTFQGIRLCHLDISYNNLSTLSENAADWPNVAGGVNLQGNPWDCVCELQWMLDVVLQDLYVNHPTYLHEFRCASPRPLQGMRFVHWYDRKEKAFCTQSKNLSNYVLLQSTNSDSDVGILMSGGGTVIAILVAIGAALILCIGLIVYLVTSKYRHSKAVNRQMMRKRQAVSDAKMLNRTSTKQNEYLNSV